MTNDTDRTISSIENLSLHENEQTTTIIHYLNRGHTHTHTQYFFDRTIPRFFFSFSFFLRVNSGSIRCLFATIQFSFARGRQDNGN